MDNAILELWLAWPSWYMNHYTMLSKYGNCTRLLKKLKTSWKSVVFTNKVGENSRYYVAVFNKTIIPLALVEYATRLFGYLPSHIQSTLVELFLNSLRVSSPFKGVAKVMREPPPKDWRECELGLAICLHIPLQFTSLAIIGQLAWRLNRLESLICIRVIYRMGIAF